MLRQHSGVRRPKQEESTCAFSEIVGDEMMLKYFHGSPSTCGEVGVSMCICERACTYGRLVSGWQRV